MSKASTRHVIPVRGKNNAVHRLHPRIRSGTGLMASSVVQLIRRFLADVDTSHREKVSALTVMEMEELENIFALLLMGAFVGLPSPPTFLAVELLPYMERELQILCKRAKESNDMLAEMFGTFGVE